MKVKLLIEAGDMKPGPALSQKLGPIGVNLGQVIQKVNEATKSFAGLKVPVELEINPSTKEFEVQVFSPPISELLKKEFGIEKGSGDQGKIKVANVSIEEIISVTKTKLSNLLARDLKAAVKSVVGTCACLGILIESKPAKEVAKEISEGKYDKDISQEKTQPSPEKKAELDEYFSEIKASQEKELAKQAAEAAAAEQKTEEKPVKETESKE